MDLSLTQLALAAAVGLFAGLLGGMLGIGGSVILIPALAVMFRDPNPESQHLYQAAAMVVNVAVSVPAALRHRRAGSLRTDVFRVLLPSAALAIIIGVMLSNLIPGLWLRRLFAAFLAITALADTVALAQKKPDHELEAADIRPRTIIPAGVMMGLAAGMLGIGGGVVGIPILRRMARLPLRQCIGVSSGVMCLTAIVGSGLKVTTLAQHGYPPVRAAILAGALAPTAVIGGLLGAGLTRRLPLGVVRVAMVLVLAASAWRMAGL